jgi:hypothetical protein
MFHITIELYIIQWSFLNVFLKTKSDLRNTGMRLKQRHNLLQFFIIYQLIYKSVSRKYRTYHYYDIPSCRV